MGRRGKILSRTTMYPSEDEMLTLLGLTGPQMVNVPPRDQLVSSKDSAVLRALWWSLLLARWTFKGSSNQVSLGKWESLLLGLHRTTLSESMAIPLRCPSYQCCLIPARWVIWQCPFCSRCFLVGINVWYTNLHAWYPFTYAPHLVLPQITLSSVL